MYCNLLTVGQCHPLSPLLELQNYVHWCNPVPSLLNGLWMYPWWVGGAGRVKVIHGCRHAQSRSQMALIKIELVTTSSKRKFTQYYVPQCLKQYQNYPIGRKLTIHSLTFQSVHVYEAILTSHHQGPSCCPDIYKHNENEDKIKQIKTHLAHQSCTIQASNTCSG